MGKMSDLASTTKPAANARNTGNILVCATCRSLLIRPDQHVRDKTTVVCDRETIIRSAIDGCPICTTLCENLDKHELLGKSGFEVTVAFRQWEPYVGLWITLNFAIRFGLLAVQSYGSPIQAQDPIRSDYAPCIIPVQTPLSSPNTGSQSCMDQAELWLQNCITNHKSCNAGFGETPERVLPARLLEVGSSMVKLMCTSDISTGINVSYMTLSHKWTKQDMPKLLSANIATMRKGLEPLTLPTVFRDAIKIARSFKIKYLWIDALCIIQDDTDDVQIEVARMGHIYKNAIVNMGSLNPPGTIYIEASPGLFVERDESKQAPFILKILRADFEGDFIAYRWDFAEELENSQLMGRGWVFQERLLSRRSIYFGQQMWWECGEQPACEMFPGGLPHDDRRHQRQRLTTLLGYVPDNQITQTDSCGKANDVDEIHQRWERLIEKFTQCSLTFEEDYLPALSGVAQVFRDSLRTDYHAGLFLRVEVLGLLWRRQTSHYEDHGIRPRHYRAPSWSWASINLQISFGEDFRGHKDVVAEIIDIRTIPAGLDPCGKLIGGHLTISGHLRQSTRTLSKRYTRRMSTWSMDELQFQYEWFDEGYNSDGTRPMNNCSFFLIAWSQSTYSGKIDSTTLSNEAAGGHQRIFDDRYHVDLKYVYGLILEPIDMAKSNYRRIGVFRHMWGGGRTFHDNPKPEDYPEFLDFDPENFERHTITII